MSATEVKKATKKSIQSMWGNWAISTGAILALALISLIAPIAWMPFMAALEALTIISYLRSKRSDNPNSCLRLIYLSAVILFWTMLILFIIGIIAQDVYPISQLSALSTSIHTSLPNTVILLIYPISCCVTLFSLLQGGHSPFCKYCKASRSYGNYNNFVSQLFATEARYQIKIYFAISLIYSFFSWLYFTVFQKNIESSSINMLIYIILPIALYVISLGYMAFRYLDMWIEYLDYASVPRGDIACSTLRYLVFWDDYLCLSKKTADYSGKEFYDSPFTLDLDIDKEINDDNAVRLFSTISEINNVELKLLYDSSDFNAGHRIYHYACFLQDKNSVKSLQAEWVSLGQLDRLIKDRAVSPLLASEIKRIHTITMAWKTYTREGRRLYPIKNYIPTFRLKDLKNWDVDYNDASWINIADNNEDKPLFYVKKLWRKYFTGTGI